MIKYRKKTNILKGVDVKMKEEVVFLVRDGVLVAVLQCELDHHTARRIRELIDREFFRVKPRCLMLDFSGVGFMDSSGVGLILGRVEAAGANGATVRLSGLSEGLMKLVRLSGIEKINNLSISK